MKQAATVSEILHHIIIKNIFVIKNTARIKTGSGSVSDDTEPSSLFAGLNLQDLKPWLIFRVK